MVALVQFREPEDRQRLMRIFADVDLPGSEEDHRWLADRLSNCRQNLPACRASVDMTELLAAGMLSEWGLDYARARALEGRYFPDPWLRAVPPLLRLGFPPASWALVEGGILHYEGVGREGQMRWKLRAAALRQVESEWYELGTALGLKTLVQGVTPLIADAEPPVQIALSGFKRAEGRIWLRRLRGELQARELDHAAHLLLI